MKRKKLLTSMMTLILAFSLLPASFAGDPNMDGGSNGNIGTPSASDSRWNNPYPDAVRVSIVKINPTTKAYVSTYGVLDYTNYPTQAKQIDYDFGKVNKIQYKNGASLSPRKDSYTAKTLTGLPRIINTSSYPASIKTIREFFAKERTANQIAKDMGLTYDALVAGDYKVVIEPMIYVTFGGKDYAMTATEAGLLNKQNSSLKASLGSVTHQNLPYALYLEKAEMGISAYTGVTTGRADDSTIISSLGIGIVSFRHEDDHTPPYPNLGLKYTLSVSPKNEQISGPAGKPVSLGSDVAMTLNVKSSVSISKWKSRICEEIETVDLYIKLTPPDGHTVKSKDGWKLGGTKNTITRKKLFSILESSAPYQFSFSDNVKKNLIDEGKTIKYNYTVEVWVEFKEHGTGDKVTVTGKKTSKDYASFKRGKVAGDSPTPPPGGSTPDPSATPEPTPEPTPPPERVAYTSEPEAFGELKQGTIGNEAFEAMAGTPTTRDLYFSVGGSEFIVDFEGLILKNNTAERTYHAHYNGCDCEFKAGDQAKGFTFPSPSGATGNSISVASMHDGGSCSAGFRAARLKV